MNAVSEIRSFSRFYTRRIGLLAEHLPASDFSLGEARALTSSPRARRPPPSSCARSPMDEGHLSRIAARFRQRGLLEAVPDSGHGKRLTLRLTAAGRQAFAAMNHGTETQMEALLQPMGEEGRRRLLAAPDEVKAAFGGTPGVDVLRALRPGDIGWAIHRQTVLHHREYGWDWTCEGLAAEILAGFVASFDPAREDAWIAERNGSTVGSVFLMKSGDPGVAKLRLLYVEPTARGRGRRLMETCVERARALGYAKLTLWTNSELVAARRIYETAGFRLVDETPHRSFGHDLVGQTWLLDLVAPDEDRRASRPRASRVVAVEPADVALQVVGKRAHVEHAPARAGYDGEQGAAEGRGLRGGARRTAEAGSVGDGSHSCRSA